jgi:hypothetical protein
MSRKRFTPERIIGKLREADVALSAMIRQLSPGQKLPYPEDIQPFWPEGFPAAPTGNLAFPDHRHLKSSSPQMWVPDMEIISGVFAALVITERFGK